MYDVWLFVELLVVYFLFVETHGASLEETAAILDGAEIQERFVEGVARAPSGPGPGADEEGDVAAAHFTDDEGL